ncbi:MAG: LytTR family DNA-binding domain-containing protein, partial [Marinoscillum sp.]
SGESVKADNKNLFIKTDSLLISLEINSINYLEAYGDYVKIHTDDKTHVVYSKFKSVEDKLSPNEFIRIHRSYIVRLDKIKNIDQGNLQLGDKILPVSSSYRSGLLERIKTL